MQGAVQHARALLTPPQEGDGAPGWGRGIVELLGGIVQELAVRSLSEDNALRHLRDVALGILDAAPQLLREAKPADGGGFNEGALAESCLGELLLYLLDALALCTKQVRAAACRARMGRAAPCPSTVSARRTDATAPLSAAAAATVPLPMRSRAAAERLSPRANLQARTLARQLLPSLHTLSKAIDNLVHVASLPVASPLAASPV